MRSFLCTCLAGKSPSPSAPARTRLGASRPVLRGRGRLPVRSARDPPNLEAANQLPAEGTLDPRRARVPLLPVLLSPPLRHDEAHADPRAGRQARLHAGARAGGRHAAGAGPAARAGTTGRASTTSAPRPATSSPWPTGSGRRSCRVTRSGPSRSSASTSASSSASATPSASDSSRGTCHDHRQAPAVRDGERGPARRIREHVVVGLHRCRRPERERAGDDRALAARARRDERHRVRRADRVGPAHPALARPGSSRRLPRRDAPRPDQRGLARALARVPRGTRRGVHPRPARGLPGRRHRRARARLAEGQVLRRALLPRAPPRAPAPPRVLS